MAKKQPLVASPRLDGRRPSRPATFIEVSGGRGYYSALGYRAVTVARSEGRGYTNASGDRHELCHRLPLIAQSREFMRNNGLYKGLIERAVGYIIGNGFGLQAKSADEHLNTQAEELFKAFWRRPEIRRLLTGHRTGRMLGKEILTCGDMGAILTTNGLLQLIESEQIVDKNGTGDGVSKGNAGNITSFWVAPYGKHGIEPGKGARIPAESFLFITDPERPSSTRGIPPCQSAFPMLHRINDVCDSEALAYQMLSRIAISVNRAEGSVFGYNESKPDDSKSDSDKEGDLARRMIELDTALVFNGLPGETVTGIERNIPGKDFSASLYMFLRLLGLPLGLPLEVILLDWTKSNYSQSRAVLEQAYQTFLGWQLLIEDMFFRPLFDWLVSRWVAEGSLPEGAAGLDHEWIKPSFPWIDQLKESQAQGAMVDRGFTTHSAVCKSRNADRLDIVNQREKEIRDAIARVKKIKDDTGVDVPWQPLAGMLPPQAVSVTKPGDDSSSPAPDESDDEKPPKGAPDEE